MSLIREGATEKVSNLQCCLSQFRTKMFVLINQKSGTSFSTTQKMVIHLSPPRKYSKNSSESNRRPHAATSNGSCQPPLHQKDSHTIDHHDRPPNLPKLQTRTCFINHQVDRAQSYLTLFVPTHPQKGDLDLHLTRKCT